jgi:hypothetical protein
LPEARYCLPPIEEFRSLTLVGAVVRYLSQRHVSGQA